MASAEDWHSSAELRTAVASFHERNSRQPFGVDVAVAKQTLEQLKIDIKKQMIDQGVFVCSRYEHRGSSYEGVKIKKDPTNNDLEYDLMFVIEGGSDLQAVPVQGRAGYSTLKPKPGKENRPVFQKTLVGGAVSAAKLRNLFYSHLIKCKPAGATLRYNGPAVQMDVMRNGLLFFSVDFAPHFDLGPSGGIFVPKAPNGDLTSSDWFRSYSLQEKAAFDGMDRDNGCRKMVLRVLKALKKNSELGTLKSNQLKTVLLQEVRAQPSWRQDQLGQRLMDVLKRLEDDLTRGRMNHYYMPEVNLFNFSPQAMENMSSRIRRVRRNKSEMMAVLTR